MTLADIAGRCRSDALSLREAATYATAIGFGKIAQQATDRSQHRRRPGHPARPAGASAGGQLVPAVRRRRTAARPARGGGPVTATTTTRCTHTWPGHRMRTYDRGQPITLIGAHRCILAADHPPGCLCHCGATTKTGDDRG